MADDPKAKPDCRACVHRLNIPGSAHSRCNNFEAKVVAHRTGVERGWFRWPLNYDPTWLIDCDGFSADPADKRARRELSPMAELLAILG